MVNCGNQFKINFNKMTERTIKIKELIHNEVCMGTYGLVELELLEIEKEMEALKKTQCSCKQKTSSNITQISTRNRASIQQEIKEKEEKIKQISEEITTLMKEDYLLSDEEQWFEEKEEEVIISKRPKKTEKKLIGRIFWKQPFIDEDTDEVFYIERTQIVRVNGEWL